MGPGAPIKPYSVFTFIEWFMNYCRRKFQILLDRSTFCIIYFSTIVSAPRLRKKGNRQVTNSDPNYVSCGLGPTAATAEAAEVAAAVARPAF